MQPKTSFKKTRLLRLLVVGVLTAMPVGAQSTLQQPKGTEVQQAPGALNDTERLSDRNDA